MNGEPRPERPVALSVGLLRPCILAHLVGGDTGYGYELHHWLLAIGLECDLGTVYRSLNTMEAEGLLHSTWERTPGGRSRRRYELSESGLDMVDTYVRPVEQLIGVAHEFLMMRKALSGSNGESHENDATSHSLPAPAASFAAHSR
ncbi:MAG TPA: helix-turn-helix transcriptional regulator [Candidatus Dormibacteraeota bacterium]